MFQLRLLGHPLLLDPDGRPVQLWRPQAALLAYLSRSSGGRVARSTLAGVLWPEVPEADARRSLRQTLFRLRRACPGAVRASGETLALDGSALRVDVRELERLLEAGEWAEAMELYRGGFLDGFSLPGSAAFGQWTEMERDRLARRAAAACEELAASAAALGDWNATIGWSARWAELAPHGEAPVAALVKAHAAAGDRSAAVSAFERFRDRALRELGVPVSRELEALLDKVRRTEAPSHDPPVHASAAETRSPAVPLVGRAVEFRRLVERWTAARAGESQLVLLTGEPGIGKTRLLEEFLSWARLEGATVLATRAYEIERAVPYAALAGIFRACTEAPGLGGASEHALAEIARVVPEIGSRFGQVAQQPEDIEAGRVRLLDAARELLSALAYEAPVVVCVDDAPWADEASLAALHYAWRTLRREPLFYLLAGRHLDVGPGAPFGRLFGEALREAVPSVERLELGPLAPGEAARLLESAHLLPPDRDAASAAAALQGTAGGNPLFLMEAARALREGSPASSRETVRTLIAERTSRLSASARSLLRGAAVLGRRFPLPLASAVAELDSRETLDGVEELLRAGIVRQEEYGYDFVHDLLRETVYTELSAERRRHLHGRAYERLVPGPDEPDVGIERATALAQHAEAAGRRAAAHDWLLRAARHATALFAGAEAESFLLRALSLAEDVEAEHVVWVALGDLRFARARFGAAALAYHEALRRDSGTGGPRVQLRMRALDAALRSGLLHLADASAALDELLQEAAESGEPLRGEVFLAAATVCLHVSQTERASELVEVAVASARRRAEPRVLVRALLLQARVLGATSDFEPVLGILEEAAALARADGLGAARADVEIERATELCRRGRWAEAEAQLRAVLPLARRLNLPASAAIASLNLADLLIRRGQWQPALDLLRDVEEIGARYDFPHLLVGAAANEALLLWYRGDPEAAVRVGRLALERAVEARLPAAERSARAVLLLALLQLGDAAADEQARALTEIYAGAGHTWADDREAAAVALARWHRTRGRDADAIVVLETALRLCPDPYSGAVLRLELAPLLSRADRRRARPLRLEAEAILAELGAEPLPAAAEP